MNQGAVTWITKPCDYRRFKVKDVALCAVARDGALIKISYRKGYR